MVMAMESQPNLDPKLPPSGLCNAIMLSKPHSSFVGEFYPFVLHFTRSELTTDSLLSLLSLSLADRWIGTYRTFSKDVWAQHSVATPWVRHLVLFTSHSSLADPLLRLQALAQEYPTEITVLNKFAFFWPLWCATDFAFLPFSCTDLLHP